MTTPGRRMTTPGARRTTVAPERATVLVEADDGAGARKSLAVEGTATLGNWASGSDTAGMLTGTETGLSSARMAAPAMLMYGIASAISPSTPNQKRCRRVPSPPTPKGLVIPPLCPPANAGTKPRKITTSGSEVVISPADAKQAPADRERFRLRPQLEPRSRRT